MNIRYPIYEGVYRILTFFFFFFLKFKFGSSSAGGDEAVNRPSEPVINGLSVFPCVGNGSRTGVKAVCR